MQTALAWLKTSHPECVCTSIDPKSRKLVAYRHLRDTALFRPVYVSHCAPPKLLPRLGLAEPWLDTTDSSAMEELSP